MSPIYHSKKWEGNKSENFLRNFSKPLDKYIKV